MLANPRVQGYVQARLVIRNRLSSHYRWYDLWLFFPDADRANEDAMRALEAELEALRITLLCCSAHSGSGDLCVRYVPSLHAGHEADLWPKAARIHGSRRMSS